MLPGPSMPAATEDDLLSHFPHLVLVRERPFSPDDSPDDFPDRLLHGGGEEATLVEKRAVLKVLRWPPPFISKRLVSFGQREFLTGYPLPDTALLELLKTIRKQHWAVMVAAGARAEELRAVLRVPFVGVQAWPERDPERAERRPAPLPPEAVPDGEYILHGYGRWDGPAFQRMCEAVQQLPDDRAIALAYAVVYSCLGEPYAEDGRPGDIRSRFITFPKLITPAIWYAADREAWKTKEDGAEAVLWRMLAESFVQVVRGMRVDFSTRGLSPSIRRAQPTGRKRKHWGWDLPSEDWNRARLPAIVRDRVQRLVRKKLLPNAGYRRRGYAAHRELHAVWSRLTPAQRGRLLNQLRHQLKPFDYLLFRAVLRGFKLAAVSKRYRRARSTLSGRIRSTIRPSFDAVASSLPGP